MSSNMSMYSRHQDWMWYHKPTLPCPSTTIMHSALDNYWLTRQNESNTAKSDEHRNWRRFPRSHPLEAEASKHPLPVNHSARRTAKDRLGLLPDASYEDLICTMQVKSQSCMCGRCQIAVSYYFCVSWFVFVSVFVLGHDITITQASIRSNMH